MAFEFVLMILGLTLTFDKYNIVQIFIHFLGCLFTAWFLLDSWRYTRIWYIWSFFGVVPFIIEVLIIMSAVRLSKDISLNLKG